ncbi:HlyD family efflux transporter periplasmic adaptor subunit [Desulfobulbus rhabdoformis]|uniref:HlyD family efflux transporter periplasmic adaptor subunit n=1 Tax=Desulfobulbus rhabdoformis TaxID=34032 RepID=UPI0019659C21|nr:HlyD family efflux transporter periplasmic adaptor subunit [Desulfobulbus rhabdoformis]MBM9613984.1 HlyD family efflux transporter periplasmic adaptor subunit [Desulfobulbus rhabdoformis]
MHRLLVVFLFVVGACVVSCNGEKKHGGEEKGIILFGNVDIREVQLAFQDGGRIARLLVDEGATVKPGQVVAELDPTRLQLEAERLEAERKAQAQLLAKLENGSRPQEITKARAGLDSAKASLKEARLNLKRVQVLRVTNRISQQDVDSARAKVEVLEASVRAAEDTLSLVVEGPRSEDIQSAQASLQALTAARNLARERVEDTQLHAPAAGEIRTRILEKGAMASAGSPVFTLALTDPLYVRAYVNEPDLGSLHAGMNVQIYTDSYPNKSYQGWIGYISSTAEFTPKTVETTELRTKLVYRVRILTCDPQNELRLGMPVTVMVDPSGVTAKSPSCQGEE